LVGGAALTSELQGRAVAAGINLIETYGSTETAGGCIYNGVPLDGVEVKVGDDHRIAIRGKNLAYQLVDSEGWYHTSDLGHFEDGKLIVDGRIDDVVVTGGENISLTAIEKVLQKVIPDVEIAAFAVADSEWGSAIHLAWVGADESMEQIVQSALTQEIGVAAKIKKFLYLEKLPLIGIGKIDRQALGGMAHE